MHAMETITRGLFEEPFWFLVGLGLVEVVLLAIWHERRTRGLARALALPIALGIVVYLTAALVVTDRERMVQALERLAADMAGGKVDILAETLDEKVVVDLGEYGGNRLDKANAIHSAERSLRQYSVTKIRIGKVEVEMSDRPRMVVTTVIFSDAPGIGGRGMPLRWRLRWIERDGQWRILEIHRPEPTLGLK